jgi:SMP-30/Gluconolactonase/LRE-like region
VLYVNDSRRGHIRAFDVAANGTLAMQTDRVFADLRGLEPGVPDGMKVDTAGNVYCGGAGGIYILDPKGKKLGRIVHGYVRQASPREAKRRRSPQRRFGGNSIVARSTWRFVVCLRCGRKTAKCCGRAATLRQPPRRFDFNPPLRFLLGDEAGNMVTLAIGPSNSDVPSRS